MATNKTVHAPLQAHKDALAIANDLSKGLGISMENTTIHIGMVAPNQSTPFKFTREIWRGSSLNKNEISVTPSSLADGSLMLAVRLACGLILAEDNRKCEKAEADGIKFKGLTSREGRYYNKAFLEACAKYGIVCTWDDKKGAIPTGTTNKVIIDIASKYSIDYYRGVEEKAEAPKGKRYTYKCTCGAVDCIKPFKFEGLVCGKCHTLDVKRVEAEADAEADAEAEAEA